MHVIAVANGELPAPHGAALGRLLEQADLVIAADGGLISCRQLGYWPDQLIGDLDSVPPELVDEARRNGVQVHQFPSDKIATDLELALESAQAAGATALTVVAAFGGRLDHELATIALLASDKFKAIAVDATDGRRSLAVVRSTIELALAVGSTVSLVPWAGDVVGVTTAGMQWPLNEATLLLGTTLGVSNVAVAERQSVSIDRGVLLAISDLLEI